MKSTPCVVLSTSIPRQKRFFLFFSGFLLFLDGMARIRRDFLSVPGWIRRTAPKIKRAARNSTISPVIPRPKDPARYLMITPVESILDPPCMFKQLKGDSLLQPPSTEIGTSDTYPPDSFCPRVSLSAHPETNQK